MGFFLGETNTNRYTNQMSVHTITIYKITYVVTVSILNPYPAELIYLNFQSLEVVSRYRDPQPQVVENYSY